MKIKKQIIFFAAAAVTLTACNSDEPATGGLSNPVPARVSADIDGVHSRAAGTGWDAGDAIGISTTTAGKTQYANMEYVTTGDGTFSHKMGATTGIFFQDTEEVTFAAYYPFTGTENTAAGIISDVTTENQANQSQFDFLFASGAKANYSAPELNFTGDAAFSHRMTRLIVNIRTDADNGFTADDVTTGTYAISGIRHSGKFNTSTGEAEATGNATDDWIITAPATDADGVRSYSMILFPQTDAALTLTATIDGADYSCALSPALDAGMSYVYSVTVKKSGLVVSASTISDWTAGGDFSGDATMPEAKPKVGDYYYSDGTYSTEPDNDKTCIGIVFYAGRHPYDHSDYTKPLTPDGTAIPNGKVRGYAVALEDAYGGNCMWGVLNVALGCFPKDSDGNVLDNGRKPQLDWNGYDWTQKIIAAAEGTDNLNATAETGYPATYYAVVSYQNTVAAPAGSSGWFLPSIGQMIDTYAQKDRIKSSGGTEFEIMYQTSSESSEDPGRIALQALLELGWAQDYTKTSTANPVRAILAF